MSYFGASGPSTNYAEFETRTASPDSRFGMALLESYLGVNREMVEALVGRYARGKRRGQLRGIVEWTRCTHGGWVTRKGLFARGITQVILGAPDGFDRRHRCATFKKVLEYRRAA